jgi:hypothetical protein
VQFRRTFNQRTIALSLATTLTFAPLLALHFGKLPSTTENAPERVSYLRLVQTPSTQHSLTKLPTEERAKRLVSSPKATNHTLSTYHSIASTPDTSTSEIVQSSSAGQTRAPERPDLPASAPIQLDWKTIRAANRASKSHARNLAESSGTYFGDEPSSKSEKLADAITRTGKEDCIGPNPGGSLLSVFDIAFKAARDKCK